MKYDELDDLPVAILDGYWTLCTPTEAMLFFIDEYLAMNFDGKPMYVNEQVVTDRDVVVALSQLLEYFAKKDAETSNDTVLVTSHHQTSGIRTAIRNYLVRKVK